MFKQLIMSTALLLSVEICGLSVSAPVIISDPQCDVNHKTLHCYVNARGDAVATWVSAHQNKEAVAISYKTHNSPWSVPEIISQEENFIFWSDCCIRGNGDLCAAWKGGNFQVQFREKQDGAWQDVVQCDEKFTNPRRDLQFDASGHLISIGSTTRITGPVPWSYYLWLPWHSIWGRYQHLGIFKQAEDHQAKQEHCTKDWWSITVDPLLLSTNENGTAYTCWVSNTRIARYLTVQRIKDDQFVGEPEAVYRLKDSVNPNGVNMSINNEGDCLISCVDPTSGEGMIFTRYQDAWSKPFVFAKKEEGFSNIQLSIDEDGNVLSVCSVEVEGTTHLKRAYKRFGREWRTPDLLARPNADRWTPMVKADGKGDFVMIWKEMEHKRGAIFGATYSTTGKTWSEPQRLSPENVSCSNCSFAFWAPGKGYIFWEENRNGFDTTIQVAELLN